MDPGTFSGKFLKLVESFTLQRFEHVTLNRVPEEVFLALLALTVIGLLGHLLVGALAPKKGRSHG